MNMLRTTLLRMKKREMQKRALMSCVTTIVLYMTEFQLSPVMTRNTVVKDERNVSKFSRGT